MVLLELLANNGCNLGATSDKQVRAAQLVTVGSPVFSVIDRG